MISLFSYIADLARPVCFPGCAVVIYSPGLYLKVQYNKVKKRFAKLLLGLVYESRAQTLTRKDVIFKAMF
jgi:hypothetical protein